MNTKKETDMVGFNAGLGLAEQDEEKARELFEKKVVLDVLQDFEERRERKRNVESGWILNMNFLSGNQSLWLGQYHS